LTSFGALIPLYPESEPVPYVGPLPESLEPLIDPLAPGREELASDPVVLPVAPLLASVDPLRGACALPVPPPAPEGVAAPSGTKPAADPLAGGEADSARPGERMATATRRPASLRLGRLANDHIADRSILTVPDRDPVRVDDG
jgi:hypothetical protein